MQYIRRTLLETNLSSNGIVVEIKRYYSHYDNNNISTAGRATALC